MKLQVTVSIDEEDDCICGRDCVFLFGDECLLFNENLTVERLPDGYVYQAGVTPGMQRCFRCLSVEQD